MARIILDREEIEAAIEIYVRDKFLPYNSPKFLHIVQERKVSAKITIMDEKPERTEALPGLAEEDLEISDAEVECGTDEKPEPITMRDPLGCTPDEAAGD